MRFQSLMKVVSLVAILVAVPSALFVMAQSSGTKIELKALLNAEPGFPYSISLKGQHIAAVVSRENQKVMVHDGVDGPPMDEILNIPEGGGAKILWSADGSRYLYLGGVGEEWVVVVDGKEAARAPRSPEQAKGGMTPVIRLQFTPGNKHWYMVLLQAGPNRSNYQLVIDGKESGPISHEDPQIAWSNDGERHAYIQTIRNNATQPDLALIVDGKRALYQAGGLQFTADGLHLLSKRRVGPNFTLIEALSDGQPLMRGEDVNLFVAPRGSGFLGIVSPPIEKDGRASYLTVDSQRVQGSECADHGGHALFMSADAKHYAARCRTWVMVDGKKGADYADGVSDVQFTADGRAVYQGSRNGRYFVVTGDQESEGYSYILSFLERARQTILNQSPRSFVVEGNSVGFIGRKETASGEMSVVVNDKSYPAVAPSQIVFSPDGSRFAFLSGRPDVFVSVDGVGYPQMVINPSTGLIGYQGSVHWSPDSKHVAWIVAIAGGKPGIAIDGKFIATVIAPRYLTFTADGKHLVWLIRRPDAPRHQIYVDGVLVADIPENPNLQNNADLYWGKENDGTIQFVAHEGGSIKRFRITPDAETSVDTLLARAVALR
jgi:hypothetical protein